MAAFFAQAHQTVASEGDEKHPLWAVNQLQVLAARVSAVKQDGAGPYLVFDYDLGEPDLEALVAN
jgi:hypothetical protein